MAESETGFDVAAAWRQVEKLAQSADSAEDPILLGALEEALRTKLDILRKHTDVADPGLAKYARTRSVIRELGFEIPEPPAEESAAWPEAPLPAGAKEIEQAEGLLRQARVHSMRGERERAKALIDQAAAMAPGSPTVLEALGDELREQGKKRQALEYYKRAMDLGPRNVGLEKKHAELTFSAFASAHSFTSKASELERMASAKAAVVLSIFFPGLGQIVAGQVAAGATFMGLWLGSWVIAFLMGFQNLPCAITGKPLPNGSPANTIIFLPVGLAILIHLSAVIHASSSAKGGGPTMGPKPPRPTPPANLPFE